MIVLRSTMEAAVEAERERGAAAIFRLTHSYGQALSRVTALQAQMQDWLMNKSGEITPEQAAQMFYAQDDAWQAAFFNTMQDQVLAAHAALPPARPGTYNPHPGVPAGEAQWYHMAAKLDNKGRETIEAMCEHARQHVQVEDFSGFRTASTEQVR